MPEDDLRKRIRRARTGLIVFLSLGALNSFSYGYNLNTPQGWWLHALSIFAIAVCVAAALLQVFIINDCKCQLKELASMKKINKEDVDGSNQSNKLLLH